MPTLPYNWDYNAHRWRGPRGLFVSDSVVRYGLEEARKLAEYEMVAISERLQRGSITLAEWQDDMLGVIKEVFLLETVVRVGPELTPTHRSDLASALLQQALYLQNFAIQIYSGAVALDGRFLWRARLYARSASNAGEAIRRAAMAAAGYTQERRMLGASEHCDDCLAVAGAWAGIGTLPPIGDSACKMNCNCHFEYR